MGENPIRWNDVYDSWTSTKTDEGLVETWVKADGVEKEVAGQILDERYRRKLTSYVSHKLPYDWVEATVQNIWEDFYGYVKLKPIKSGVGQLLFGIARNVRADAVDRLTQERQIESGVLAKESWDFLQTENHIEQLEDILVKRDQLAFLEQLPFSDRLLSDCQWVVWKLHKNLGLSILIVTRLLGKSRDVIYTSLSSAKSRLQAYIESERFYADMAAIEPTPVLPPWILPPSLGNVTLEWFGNLIEPGLTSDELKPLGLTAQEFKSEYRICLWVSDSTDTDVSSVHDPVSLVLIPKSDWANVQIGLAKWRSGARRGARRDPWPGIMGTLNGRRFIPPGHIWEYVREDLFHHVSMYHVPIEVNDDNLVLHPAGELHLLSGPDDFNLETESGSANLPKYNLRAHSPKLLLEDIGRHVIQDLDMMSKTGTPLNPDVRDEGYFRLWDQLQRERGK